LANFFGDFTLARRESGRDRALLLKALANESIHSRRAPGCFAHQSNAEISACQAAGFSPRIGHLVSNNISRLALVAAGQGIVSMLASMQRMNIEGVVFRRLTGLAHFKMPVLLASRRGDTWEVVRQFLRLAKRTARDSGAV
jgi:DNA-binding transcriptional LysR family regulator